jgi:hypothetical protein
MIEAHSQTRSLLVRAHTLTVRSAAATARYRLGALLIFALLGALVVDSLIPLPAFLRALVTLGLLAAAIVANWRLAKSARQRDVPLDRAARIVEASRPDLDNALINAVQFGQAEPGESESGELMRREMARAEAATAGLSPDDSVSLAPQRAARTQIAAACAVLLLSLLLFQRAWRFEAPRFALFWRDYPPFTLTDIAVAPGDSHVKTGGTLPIEVKVAGQIPESVSLVVESGGRERVLPLMANEQGGYSQALEGLTADSHYYVRANTGRSRRFFVSVDKAPEVRGIKATLTPPAYTGKGPETNTVGEQGIAGLNGTVADVEVESTRPLSSGMLTMVAPDGTTTSAPFTPNPGRPTTAHAKFTITRDAAYRIDLQGADGLDRRDAAKGKVALLRDEKPIVYITSPGQNAVVPPDMKLAIRSEAEDDVAIQRIEVHRIVNNMADSVVSVSAPPGRQKAGAVTPVDLADLGARPGDVIQYYATAYDNDPGKPNLTDSDRYWLWVVSKEDYEKILHQQRDLPKMTADYRAMTDALQSLADRQQALAEKAAKLAKDPKATDAQKQALKQEQAALRKEAQELAEAMKKLAQQTPQYDAERGLQQKMKELAQQVGQAAAGPMKQGESAKSPQELADQANAAAQQLKKAGAKGQQSVEKALQALEKLAPLYEDLRHLQEITKLQAELAMQARQLANQASRDSFQQSRLRELSQRQSDTQKLLEAVRQNLEEHAAQCEGDAPNAAAQARQIGQAIDRAKVTDQMGEASTEFGKLAAQEGAEQAESARRSLEQLFQKSKGAQGACKAGADKKLGMCLGQGAGDSLQQLSRGLGNGRGQSGQGRGSAMGQGGMPAPQPGSRPGDGNSQGSQAQQVAALTQLQQQQAGRSEKRENRRHRPAGESPAALDSQDVERLAGPVRPPSAAADGSDGRYPAEYRRLVKDYFRSVAGGGK